MPTVAAAVRRRDWQNSTLLDYAPIPFHLLTAKGVICLESSDLGLPLLALWVWETRHLFYL